MGNTPDKPDLQETFEALCHDLPEFAEGATPLGRGNYGIAILRHNEASSTDEVTKILFRFHDNELQERALKQLRRETEILGRFQGNPLQTIEAPVLIRAPEFINHSAYMSHYTMTHVTGTTHKRLPDPGEPTESYAARYRNAGALQARFHREVRDHDLGIALPVGPNDGISIPPISTLDIETNERLEVAHRYLRVHVRSGNIHGDFHLGNILERDGRGTGMLDFSFAGYAKNLMSDTWAIPTAFTNEFVEGYEEESGEEIRHMITASALSMWANNILRMPPEDTQKREHAAREIRALLDQMEPVL